MSLLEDGIRAVQEHAASIPPGRHGAVIAVVQPDGSFKAAVAGKVGERWTFFGYLDKPDFEPTNNTAYGAGVEYTW